MGKIVLCADSESLVRPALIGLEDVCLAGFDWLETMSDARQARGHVFSHADIDEVWVVATDEVEGINLAAAIRSDLPQIPLYLVAFEPTGSVLSRAHEAGVTGVLGAVQFSERFYSETRRRSLMDEVANLEIDAVIAPRQETESRDSGEQGGLDSGNPSPAGELTEYRHAPEYPNAFVVSVMSGSGGVGKSTVCALAASLTAARGFRTCVLDCDLQFGDMHHALKGSRSISIDDALSDPAAIDGVSGEEHGKPVVVSAPSRLESSESLFQHVSELLDLCSSSFDVVFVNTGSTWAESHAQLLEKSSCPILLMDQRASSIRACQHALELCMRLGIATGSFVYALNRCERGALFTSMDIANVMQGAHIFELKEGGHEVEELIGAGLADELASSRNDLCSSLDAMLDEILPARGPLASGAEKREGHEGTVDRASRFVMPESRTKRRGRGRRSEKRDKGQHEGAGNGGKATSQALSPEIVLSSDLMVQQ